MSHHGARTLERDVLRACLEALRARGIFAWRQNQGVARFAAAGGRSRFVRFAGVSGLPDILGLLAPSGRLLAVEVKAPGRRPSREQLEFLRQLSVRGALAFWTSDPDEMLLVIDRHLANPNP